jgi:hypothetical protein
MKEMKNIKESRILNKLIPKVIDQNRQMGQEMKKRIQLNRIFSEFENKASNGLNYFINESSQRYINLKNGHNLKNLLLNSRQRNMDKVNKIFQDPFYVDLNLEKEKEKMKIYKIKDLNKNVKPILFKIKQPKNVNNNINNISHEDNEHTSNYNEYMNNVSNKINLDSYRNRKKQVTFITQNSKKKLNPIQINKELNAAIIDKDRKSLSRLFNNEENLINKSFDDYKENILNNIDKYSNSRKQRSNMKINLPKLKLLNYKYDKNLIKNDDKTNKNEVNYKYLISFSEKNILNRKNIYNTPVKNNDFKNEIKFPLITEINNYNYKFQNYGNTSDMVINSAKKEMNLEADMSEKLDELDKLLGYQTPKTHLYDEILNKKSLTIKNERRERAKKIIENQKQLGGSIKDRLNMKIDNKVSLLDRVMNNINKYNEKKH